MGGGGRIAGYDAKTGRFKDWLRSADGKPWALAGLWGLLFGNGISLGDSNALYVAAGPEDETQSVFGVIRYQSCGPMTTKRLRTHLLRWGAAMAIAGIVNPSLAEPLAWPERITRIENMPLQTHLNRSIPHLRAKGDVQRELVGKLLVDERGTVVRGTVLQSCGYPDVDEAVLHALREARFRPFVEAGVAQAVSLVMP